MAYEKPKGFKVSGIVPININVEIDKYAGLAAMSKTQFIGVLVQLGLNAWIRAYAPEKMLSPEDWARIVEGLSVQTDKK